MEFPYHVVGYQRCAPPQRLLPYRNLFDYMYKRAIGITSVSYARGYSMTLYSSFAPRDPLGYVGDIGWDDVGDYFNLEFNPDGKMLVTTCGSNGFTVHDTHNFATLTVLTSPRGLSNNCLKFIDDKTLLTTVGKQNMNIYDIRNWDRPLKYVPYRGEELVGIDWSEKEKTLVSLDKVGKVVAWSFRWFGTRRRKLFKMNEIKKLKLTSDGNKMVLSMINGYIYVIHNLDLSKLNNNKLDWSCKEFNPRKKNQIVRINICRNDDLELNPIALELHPKGWVAVTRSANRLGTEEWTSVHYIDRKNCTRYPEAMLPDEAFESTGRYRFGKPLTMPYEWTPIVEHIELIGQLKLLSFSADGRVFASPFGPGMRLYGFNDKCEELSQCIKTGTQQLTKVLLLNKFNTNNIIGCRFNPKKFQLVSVCRNLTLRWYDSQML